MGRQATHGLDQREGRDDPRSRLCVIRLTRAFSSSCCALSTSSVVRWPTRASSRTPVSAVSAASTWISAPESARMRPPASPGRDHIARTSSRACSIRNGTRSRSLLPREPGGNLAVLIEWHGQLRRDRGAGLAIAALLRVERRSIEPRTLARAEVPSSATFTAIWPPSSAWRRGNDRRIPPSGRNGGRLSRLAGNQALGGAPRHRVRAVASR